MAEHPTLLGRLFAAVHGEIAADTLEAYRRAGNAVYDLLKQVEEQRLAMKIQGTSPWQADSAAQALFLCAWNAFALQTLGDEFLDADFRADPATVGYVPPVTAQQVHAFYAQVEEWISRAHQAQSNPTYRLDVHLPADLPPWVEVDPCPRPHLEAMLAAARSIRTHAEAALATSETDSLPKDAQSTVQQVRQLVAAANTHAEYADGLWSQRVTSEVHEQIERHLKAALEGYYHLGQCLAMPSLAVLAVGQGAETPADSTRPTSPRLGRSGTSTFDPWCLTDPFTRDHWKRDPKARAAIAALWQYDPEPESTLAIQDEIDASLARGEIAYAMTRTGDRLGNFYCCPWSAIYVVKRPVVIGGRRLRTLQQFTYDVSAEGVQQGEGFKRDILVANFQPVDRVDYCDPNEREHDD